VVNKVKPETKETLNNSVGEIGLQIALALLIGALGGLGLADVLFGLGVFWLLFPFGGVLYWAYSECFQHFGQEGRCDAKRAAPLP
jgi:hypothetical protein